MRFGRNLLRGAQPIPDPNGGGFHGTPGGSSTAGAGGASLGALARRYRTPALIGAAGVVVILGLRHRANGAQAAASAPLPGIGDPSLNGATVAGYTPADTSGTDVYNALQPQVEQTQTMLSQLLDALANAPAAVAGVVAPNSTLARRPRTVHRRKTKPKRHPKRRPRAPRPVAHRPPRRRVAPPVPAKPRRAPAPAPHKARRHHAHVVRRGETAASIARRYGTNPVALVTTNSRLRAARVVPGSRLVIPDKRVRRA